MYDDWRDQVTACVHEDSRDERKAQRYQLMIREWAEEIVRKGRGGLIPAQWPPDALDIQYDPIAITTHAGTPLNKKYATLAAIHDDSQHCDFPLDPWAGRQEPIGDQCSEKEQHELNVSLKYELLKRLVLDLTDDDQPGITQMLDDVAEDFEQVLGGEVARVILPKIPGVKGKPENQPGKSKRLRSSKRSEDNEFRRGREDTIANAIRNLAENNEKVTARAVSNKCTGRDGKQIPEGTIRNSEAWKNRSKTIEEAGGAQDAYEHLNYFSTPDREVVDESARTPVDEIISREDAGDF